MERISIGELEELILLCVSALSDDAYGVSIRKMLSDRAGRDVTLGTVHASLHRLEKKGLLTSRMGGATEQRGGRRKRLYSITGAGLAAVGQAREARINIRSLLPSLHPLRQ